MAEEQEQQSRTVTIDGTQYQLDQLSDNARQQLAHLSAADAEIRRIQAQLAMARTARQAYARALQGELPAS
ncbi:hypothetical protein CKO15_07200 [Halorhodospira abdelmalekii]|uniref:DUF6447 family protein n=1 Tax=Halorhodospira abdelmalekii TaxID=421629 RepID=UPI00190458D7|nr:DUF6447 family protein [Halorhodospira abdelmalekii]MBK1735074.1 hypothetical protein [Halorhodospira abdelmalekii]